MKLKELNDLHSRDSKLTFWGYAGFFLLGLGIGMVIGSLVTIFIHSLITR